MMDAHLFNIFVASDAADSLDWCGQARAESALEACADYNALERNCEPGERYVVVRVPSDTPWPGIDKVWRFVYEGANTYGDGNPQELLPLLREES